MKLVPFALSLQYVLTLNLSGWSDPERTTRTEENIVTICFTSSGCDSSAAQVIVSSGRLPTLRKLKSFRGSCWKFAEFFFIIGYSNKTSLSLLPPRRFEWNLRCVIFKVIRGWGIFFQIALRRWMLLDPTDDKATLDPVMAWCSQC